MRFCSILLYRFQHLGSASLPIAADMSRVLLMSAARLVHMLMLQQDIVILCKLRQGSACQQVTRQLGPVQQPRQAPSAASPTPMPAAPTQTPPSHDMAINTDGDMGGLEGLVMNPDVMMTNPSADPFSVSQGSYPQQHMTDGGSSSRSSDYTAQQQQQQQSTWASGTALATAQRQPSQPIFFQGQWFMPAPPGFTPPPGLAPPVQRHQELYGGGSQHLQGPLQGPHTPQAPPQAPPQQRHQQGPHTHHQQLQQQQLGGQQPQQQLPQQWQHQQPGLYAHSGHLRSVPGQSAAAPGLAPANTAAAKDQAWSPTGAYQFESPTFRNGAAQQLSPGESGRTWSPVASDITRLTLPQPQAAPPQQKVCFITACPSVCVDLSIALSVSAWLNGCMSTRRHQHNFTCFLASP